jgi:hypothetical protein
VCGKREVNSASSPGLNIFINILGEDKQTHAWFELGLMVCLCSCYSNPVKVRSFLRIKTFKLGLCLCFLLYND